MVPESIMDGISRDVRIAQQKAVKPVIANEGTIGILMTSNISGHSHNEYLPIGHR